MGFLGTLADVAGGVGEGLLPGVETGVGLRRQKLAEEEARRRRSLEDEETVRIRQEQQLRDQELGIVRGNAQPSITLPTPDLPQSLFEGTPLDPAARDQRGRVFDRPVFGEDTRGPQVGAPAPLGLQEERFERVTEDFDPASQFGGPFAFFDLEKRREFEEMLPAAQRQREAATAEQGAFRAAQADLLSRFPDQRGRIELARTVEDLQDIAEGELPGAKGRADIAAAGRRNVPRLGPTPSQVSQNLSRRQAREAGVIRQINSEIEAAGLDSTEPADQPAVQRIQDEVATDLGFESFDDFQRFNVETTQLLRGGEDRPAGPPQPRNEFEGILLEMKTDGASDEDILKILADEGLQSQEIEAARTFLASLPASGNAG